MMKSAAIANGTPMKKLPRHPKVSVMNPPSSGPPMVANAMMPPTMPMYLPRSRGETMSATTICTSAIRPPAPSPCTTRIEISISVLCEKPAMTVPITKIARATCSSTLRLVRSASLPQMGVETAVARRVAVMTQV